MHDNEIQFSKALTLHQTHTALVGGQLLNAPTWIDTLSCLLQIASMQILRYMFLALLPCILKLYNLFFLLLYT